MKLNLDIKDNDGNLPINYLDDDDDNEEGFYLNVKEQ
jgi:hypothetical protein